MFIEIEKKFELTDAEHEIIKSKLELDSKENIEDIYLDLPDFYLIFNKMKFRIRNGKKELKIKIWNLSSEEYYEKEAIKKIEALKIQYENIKTSVCTIETYREKYKWKFNWKDYIIDIDKHSWWKRYEIEVESESEELGSKLIDEITDSLWLKAIESQTIDTKLMSNVKIQNPKLYEVLIENNIYW